MGTLTYKKVKETDKDYAHTDVFYNEIYIGYYIRNTSKFSQVGESWNFASHKMSIENKWTRTQKLMRLWLESVTTK